MDKKMVQHTPDSISARDDDSPHNNRAEMDSAPTVTLPNRKSIRLKGYDYSQAGLYFITICTQGRGHLFGKIMDEKMVLNDAGKMIEQIWRAIPDDFIHARLHEYIIMPNHIHGIIEIVGADSISARDDDSISARHTDSRAEMDSALTVTSIPRVIQSFKRHTTIQYINMVKRHILPPFDQRIWQRNYWEHIVRNEPEYHRIAQYILNNPKKWDMDKLNGRTGDQTMEPQGIYYEEAWMV